MPTARVADALRTLARDPDPPADGDLVSRFADRRDEAAFAELIRRHGPTVFGVCRRILGHAHDAEDAFQAVWLVFARRAADVQPPGSVGNFLYGVAVRTATKARTVAAKRRLRLMSAAKPEPVVDPPADSDLRAVLDEELGRLPDKYRAAVVLCDLTGKSRSVAAAELGWPEGTVAARLAKGRDLLADRLRRRGVSLSAGALAAALAPEATAATVPAALAHEALAASLGWATASPSATLLAEGVMRTLSVARWKLPAVALTLCGLAATVVFAAQSAQPRQQPVARPAAPAVEAAPRGNSEWKESAVIDLVGWLPGSVAYSPDGKTLLVGGTDGHVQAFDTTKRNEIWKYRNNAPATLTAVAYSRDGEAVAVTYKNGVVLLNAPTGKEIDSIQEADSDPRAVGFFANQPVAEINEVKRGLVFGDARSTFAKSWIKWPNVGTVQVAALNAGQVPADPFAVPLAVDPRVAANTHAVMTGPLRQETGKNVLWAYACGGPGGNHLLEGHKATVTVATWSADGKTIVTGDAEGVVILWDAATFKEKSRLGFDRRVVAAALSPDGSRAAVGIIANDQIQGAGEPSYHELVYVWDAVKPPAKPGEPIGKAGPFGGPFQGIAGLAFTPNGKSLAAGFANFVHLSRLGRLIGKVRVWTLAEAAKHADPKPGEASFQFRQRLGDHGDGLNAIALAPGGKMFATGGRDGEVVVWDAVTRKPTLRFQPNKAPVNTISHRVYAVAYSPDGKFIAVSHRDGVSLHDAKTGELTNFPGRKGPIDSGQAFVNPYTLAFSPDGKLFASTASGHGLRIIDTTTGFDVSWPLDRSIPEPKLPDPPPDNDGVAPRSAGVDPPIVTALAFSPDGSKLARTENVRARGQTVTSRVRIHESRSGKLLATIDCPGWVLSLAWSNDGKRLAGCGTGGNATVWDGESFQVLRKFDLGVETEATSVAFTPDGSTLATSLFRHKLVKPNTATYEFESEIRLWDHATGAERQRLQGHPDERFSALAFSEDGEVLFATAGKLYEPKGGTGPAGRKEPGGVIVWDRGPRK